MVSSDLLRDYERAMSEPMSGSTGKTLGIYFPYQRLTNLIYAKNTLQLWNHFLPLLFVLNRALAAKPSLIAEKYVKNVSCFFRFSE